MIPTALSMCGYASSHYLKVKVFIEWAQLPRSNYKTRHYIHIATNLLMEKIKKNQKPEIAVLL